MPIEMKVDVEGIDLLQRKLSNAEAVRGPMRRFLLKAGQVGKADVRSRIPVRAGGAVLRHGRSSAPGRGRRSVRAKLQLSDYQVTVFSPLYYVRFLAAGTKRGILPRMMFAKSVAAIAPKIQALAQEMIREIVGTVNRGN